MSNELAQMLKDIALGKAGQIKSIEQVSDGYGNIKETKRITDAVPNAELIKELIDLQIGGEKDWC